MENPNFLDGIVLSDAQILQVFNMSVRLSRVAHRAAGCRKGFCRRSFESYSLVENSGQPIEPQVAYSIGEAIAHRTMVRFVRELEVNVPIDSESVAEQMFRFMRSTYGDLSFFGRYETHCNYETMMTYVTCVLDASGVNVWPIVHAFDRRVAQAIVFSYKLAKGLRVTSARRHPGSKA